MGPCVGSRLMASSVSWVPHSVMPSGVEQLTGESESINRSLPGLSPQGDGFRRRSDAFCHPPGCDVRQDAMSGGCARDEGPDMTVRI